MLTSHSKKQASNHLVLVRHSGTSEFARVSPGFAEEIGFTNEELSAKPFLEWIHTEDQAALRSQLESKNGQVLARHQTRSGEWFALDWRIRSDESGLAVLGLLPGENGEQPNSGTPDRDDLSETLESMALIVERKNPGMKCSILLIDEAGERVSVGAGPSFPDEYNEAVEGLRIGPTVGSCGTAAYWNIPVVVEDIATDPLWRDLRGAAGLAGVAACWSHPITATNGEMLGAMALYNMVPRAPEQHHMDGLEIAARMVGLAIERDRLKEQLLLSAKMEALGVLAGGIAHDFNNMLAAVLGNAELALDSLPDDAPASSMLQEIVRTSVSAAELCSQMLAYAGRGAMTPETVECSELLKEIGGLLHVALAKKAELHFQLDDQELHILADRSQLRQVVMNLITNAPEALGNNAGVIGIGTSARLYTREELTELAADAALEPGEYVCLSVSDTGDGMSHETRTKIFDPFFTTKAQGRGLGLAAVRGIVRRHKGAIVLEGGRGSGTRFSVLLPRVQAPSTIAAQSTFENPTGCEGRILVVDDEPAVRKVLAMMLETGGYDVIRAADGQEAIDIFRERGDEIDCVILDLSMPKLDGDEVFHELRKLRSDVRVILSSGFTEQQVMNRFGESGLAGVVKKPTEMHVLLEKVARVLKSRD